MITSVCQTFDFFPSFHVTWYTFVNQRIYSPFNAFNILVRILSSLAAFPHFNPRTAAATFVNGISSLPKSILLHVSVGVALTGFNKSSKYYLHREKISFSSLGMFPIESLIKVVAFNFFHASGEWSAKMLCLPMNSWNPTDDEIFPKYFLWTFLLRFAHRNIGIAN